MKRYFLFILLAVLTIHIKGQNFEVSGVVSDLKGNGVSNAGIFIKNASGFTYTNDTGYYTLLLPNGTFTLFIQKEGYETYTSSVKVIDTLIQLNFKIKSLASEIDAVKLAFKRIDISKEIVRSAVDAKEKYTRNNAYSAKLYIRASEKQQGQKYDSIRKETVKDTFQRSLAEVYLKLDVSLDGEIKEERLAVKKQGNQTGLYWLSATEGIVNVYQNLISMDGVCDVPIISPISNAGLVSYKYRTENIWFENGMKYYRIGVTPVGLGNALADGYIIIEDSTFRVLRMALVFPEMHVPEYDRFAITQDYIYPKDSVFLISKQQFKYNTKKGKNEIVYGETNVSFDSFQLDKNFEKKHFGAMLSLTSIEAYKQDTNFWNSVRADSLSLLEYEYSKKQDSFKAIRETDAYKDSIQQAQNKIKLVNILFWGQSHGNYKKKKEIYFDPLLRVYKPVSIAGARLGYGVYYVKYFENRTNIFIRPNLDIGIRNKDLKGSLYVHRLFDAKKRKEIGGMIDRRFATINSNDAWLNTFRRSNFYEVDRARVYYRQEVVNGLYFSGGTSISDRRSIEKYKFSEFGDSLFVGLGDTTRNRAIEFETYKAVYIDLSLDYTPGQKYMMEPYEKVILGSKYPTFTLSYKRGIPKVWNSSIDFEYVNFEIAQQLKLGLIGKMNYRFSTGKFLQTRDLRLVDYVFQANSNPYFFSNPNYTFQSLDSVYRTFDWFFEGHIMHRFNGAILNKIPLLKKLHLVETVGGGFLISPENKLTYFEAYSGIERSFRLFNEQFRLGLYLVAAKANRFEVPLRLKFSLEFYNRQENKWSF